MGLRTSEKTRRSSEGRKVPGVWDGEGRRHDCAQPAGWFATPDLLGTSHATRRDKFIHGVITNEADECFNRRGAAAVRWRFGG